MGADSDAIGSENNADIVLLAGAGASRYLGLPALDDLLERATLGTDDVADRIRRTSNAIRAQPERFKAAAFEEITARIRYYLETAEMLRTDYCFRRELGSTPSDVDNGSLEWKWRQALTRCYRVLLNEYGPQKISPESTQFQTTLKLLEGLAKINSGKLHIYTTNYDCSYQVLASNCENISFLTHIDNQNGVFRERWFNANPNLGSSGLPLIYMHRLHGCVAWFTDDARPFRVEEAYGAGDILEIGDDDYLSRMCIKLVASQLVGANPAFVLAFEEFSDHLRSAKALLVWGYSFRDLEVLRTINRTFSSREAPLKVYYIDPFLLEGVVINNIRSTLGQAPVQVAREFKPEQIGWSPADGHNNLVFMTIEALNEGV